MCHFVCHFVNFALIEMLTHLKILVQKIFFDKNIKEREKMAKAIGLTKMVNEMQNDAYNDDSSY